MQKRAPAAAAPTRQRYKDLGRAIHYAVHKPYRTNRHIPRGGGLTLRARWGGGGAHNHRAEPRSRACNALGCPGAHLPAAYARNCPPVIIKTWRTCGGTGRGIGGMPKACRRAALHTRQLTPGPTAPRQHMPPTHPVPTHTHICGDQGGPACRRRRLRNVNRHGDRGQAHAQPNHRTAWQEEAGGRGAACGRGRACGVQPCRKWRAHACGRAHREATRPT